MMVSFTCRDLRCLCQLLGQSRGLSTESAEWKARGDGVYLLPTGFLPVMIDFVRHQMFLYYERNVTWTTASMPQRGLQSPPRSEC